MSMKLWIRQFGLKIWNKIEDHIAGCIAAAIVGILAVLFWEWVTNEHSVELYGWVWLLLCFVFVFLLVHFILTMFRRPKKLKDPADIRNVLSKWWRHAKEQCPDQTEFTLYFSSIDRNERLEKGSAKKYLQEVIMKDTKWRVVRKGSDTLSAKRNQLRQEDMFKK